MQGRALVISTTTSRLASIRAAVESAGWFVTACQNPKQAVDHLTGGAFDAVFCDTQLSGASASGFLAWSRRAAPQASFFIVGDARLRGQRPDGTLPFPIGTTSVPGPNGETPRPAKGAVGDGALPLTGDTTLVPLDALLDMMGVAQQEAVVELVGRGRVYVAKGRVQHAEAMGKTGISALSELLQDTAASFQVLPFSAPPRATVNLPASTALTEAARLGDELHRQQELAAAASRLCEERGGKALAVAAGYLHAFTPQAGSGDSGALFDRARSLLQSAREATSAGATVALAATEKLSLAVCLHGDDQLVAAESQGLTPQTLLGVLFQAIGTGE